MADLTSHDHRVLAALLDHRISAVESQIADGAQTATSALVGIGRVEGKLDVLVGTHALVVERLDAHIASHDSAGDTGSSWMRSPRWVAAVLAAVSVALTAAAVLAAILGHGMLEAIARHL